jgi:hypothetical protein
VRFWRDRRAWRKAQRTHVFEHETNQPLSLSCDAVGHTYMYSIDEYSDYFDHNSRRKFCLASGRKWSGAA